MKILCPLKQKITPVISNRQQWIQFPAVALLCSLEIIEKWKFGEKIKPVMKLHWWGQIVSLFIVIWCTVSWGVYCYRRLKLCCHYNRRLAESPHLMPALQHCLFFHQQPSALPPPPTLWATVLAQTPHLKLQPISLTTYFLPSPVLFWHCTLKSEAFDELKREI